MFGKALVAVFLTISGNSHLAAQVIAPVASNKAPAGNPIVHTDIVYGHKMGMALTLDVIQPVEQNGAAVIFVVSGGWNSNWFPPESYKRIELLEQLVSKGYVVIMLRHGSAPLFKVPDAIADVKQAATFLHEHCEEYQFANDRMGVCGMSAGGHLSLMLGTATNQRAPKDDAAKMPKNTTRVAAVVAYFPPTDLRPLIGPSDDFPALDFDAKRGNEVSPLVHVTADDAPTLLVHGTNDRLVPIQHSKQIKTAFEEHGVVCELVTIEGAGHGFRGEAATQATTAALEWFDRFLSPQTGK